MILRELQVTNFRQITGTYSVKFALPGDRPVTLILGENGAGKTTLLSACLWCLYGRKDFENPEEIISHRAIELAASGEDVESRVRLVFEAGEKTYTIERAARIRKRAGEPMDKLDAEELHVDVTDERGVTKPSGDPRQEIGQLMPEALSGFFFFRGEDLEDLVAQAGSDKLKDAVETFVDLLVLDRSIAHLADVIKNLEKNLQQVTAGDAKRLTDEVKRVGAEIDTVEQEIAEAKSEKSKLNVLKQEVEDKLAAVEEVRPLLEERRSLDQELAHLDQRIADKRDELAEVVSDDGFLHLRSDVLQVGRRLAEEARQRGELPAKVKPQFVNDLIQLGKCICGQEIDPAMRENLEHWRSTSALGDLEEAVTSLGSHLLHLRSRADRFKDAFQAKRLELAELTDQREQTQNRRSQVESEILGRDFGLEEVQQLQAAKRSADDELVNVRVTISRLQERAQVLEIEREELRARREKNLKAEEKGARISRQIQATSNVRRGMIKLRTGWVSIVQEYLDQELRRKWEEMAQLPRKVEFDEEFRLTIKERGGDGEWRASAPSSANRRALALSFVTALIKLADKARAPGKGERLLFTGGHYPLIMDAPFATMDSHFKQTVPVGLRKTVPQLVLVTNHDQWTGEVEASLGNAVGAAYVLALHAPKETGTTVHYRGVPVDYVIGDPDSAYDWSEIKEIAP